MKFDLDPRIRIFCIVWVGFGSILFESWQSLLFLLFVSSIPTFFHIHLQQKGFALLTSMLVIIWGTAISQGLFYAQQPRQIWISIGDIALYKEGLQHGMIQSLRFLSVILAGVSFSLYTSPSMIFRALIALKIPYSLALMAMIALQSVGVISNEIQHIRRARSFRGRVLWKRNPQDWIKQELMMLKPIVIRTYRRSIRISETLMLRGFIPNTPRTQYRELFMNRLDWSLFLVLATSLMLFIFARSTLWLYQMDLYYHPQLRFLYEWTRVWM